MRVHVASCTAQDVLLQLSPREQPEVLKKTKARREVLKIDESLAVVKRPGCVSFCRASSKTQSNVDVGNYAGPRVRGPQVPRLPDSHYRR